MSEESERLDEDEKDPNQSRFLFLSHKLRPGFLASAVCPEDAGLFSMVLIGLRSLGLWKMWERGSW